MVKTEIGKLLFYKIELTKYCQKFNRIFKQDVNININLKYTYLKNQFIKKST